MSEERVLLCCGATLGAYSLIQLDVLVCVAHLCEVALELLARDNHCKAVVVGVEAQRRLLAEGLIEEEVHVVLRVVDKTEGRHRAG